MKSWWALKRHSLVYWISPSGAHTERPESGPAVVVVSTWWSVAGLVWGGRSRAAVAVPAMRLAEDARAALARAIEGSRDA